MPDTKANLLIVDDARSVRTTLSLVLVRNGYATRTAENGFSALAEIRREVPDFLISDLNMPGMSGFELLTVVRRQFPSIRSIAMSGAFFGDQIPAGVEADAFFQKGRGAGDLLKKISSLPLPAQCVEQSCAVPSPVWISRYQRNVNGEGYATIKCPACMGTFPKVLNGMTHPVSETHCLFCGSLVRYAIEFSDHEALLPFQHEHASSTNKHQPSRKLEL